MEDLQAQEHLIEIVVHFHVEEEEVNASVFLSFFLVNPSSSPVVLNINETRCRQLTTCFFVPNGHKLNDHVD